MRLRSIGVVVSVCLLLSAAHAAGHGPVFGYATPVNSKGETSFDFGIVSRNTRSCSQTTAKSMVTYGLTPQLQVSALMPGLIQQCGVPMSAVSGGEFQGNIAWRFHHNPNAVGRRFETTASVGVVVPGPQDDFGLFQGLRSAPGVNAWIATGMASRSQYLWVGAGATRFASRDGDRRPDVYSTSLVWGYRPPAWRSDRHQWDWRMFAEMTGEHTGPLQRASVSIPVTDSNQIFLGPSVLGIYKAFAISGGVQFPLYSDLGRLMPRERARLALNLTYFLFSHSH